jgi:hypothetical protein
MLIERIDAALVEAARKEDRGSPLRLSNAGRCARQTAYKLRGFEPEPISPRRLRTFEYGHLTEEAVRKWLADAGVEVLDAQKEVTLDCGSGLLVSGHIDGRMVLGGEDWHLEVKSISTDGFLFASKDGPDYSYLATANAYMEADKVPRTVFLFADKNDQELCESVVLPDPAILQQVKDRFHRVAASTPDSLPEREHTTVAEKGAWRGGSAPAGTPPELVTKKGWYKPTGRKILPWMCGYCNFKSHCWGVGEPEIVGGKPVWVVEQGALDGFMR